MKIMKKLLILLIGLSICASLSAFDVADFDTTYSALNAPFQTFDGEDLYPSLQQKASRLCFGLVKNHPFTDGNKRIGAHVMLVFLALNGIELQHSQTELSYIILRLAAGEIGAEDLLHWILAHQV